MNGSICASNGKDAGNPNAEITASVVCALSIPAVRAVEMALTNWRSLSDSPYIGALHHALEARGVDDALGIFQIAGSSQTFSTLAAEPTTLCAVPRDVLVAMRAPALVAVLERLPSGLTPRAERAEGGVDSQ
jgi:hypothetical protein